MASMNDLRWYRGKRVCVTGATGLIGSYVCKLLGQLDVQHLPVGHNAIGMDLLRPEDAQTALAHRMGPFDAVINCAGITGGVGLTDIDPVSYVGPATAMMCNVLHACHLAKVPRLGFLSSTTVYAPSAMSCREGIQDGSDAPSFLRDNAALLEWFPRQLYPAYRGIGESKRFLEKLCRYYHETTGIGIGIVRPSGAYGRYDNFDEKTSHVIPGMINRALRLKPGETFEVWGDGQDVRDVIHAEDVARGLLLAVAHRSDCTPFNIASGRGVTTRELAEDILQVLARDFLHFMRADGDGEDVPRIVTDPGKPSALRSRTVDISRAQRELGFHPMIGLHDGLRDTIEWRMTQ